MNAATVLVCQLLPLAALAAQDMIAAGWDGRVHSLDSRTGAMTTLVTAGLGQNALARDHAGRLWSTARIGSTFTYYLTEIDAVRGTSTIVWPSIDLRGLTGAQPRGLWGIETLTGGAASRLWHVDTDTGAHTLLGSAGVTAIQSLAVVDGVLYGWHWVNGLMVLDPSTGRASDPFAATANGLTVQWLAAEPGGGLVGGTSAAVFDIDENTGVARLRCTLPLGTDLRGAEFTSFALPYGQGCSAGNGVIQLSARGTLQPGRVVTLESTNHVAGTLRGLALGFARDQHQGRPLPLLLDPLLGTMGCSLHVRIDLSQLYLGSGFPTASMALPLRLPVALGLTDVFVQHFDFALPWNPPGMSNGLWLHIVP